MDDMLLALLQDIIRARSFEDLDVAVQKACALIDYEPGDGTDLQGFESWEFDLHESGSYPYGSEEYEILSSAIESYERIERNQRKRRRKKKGS